MKHLLWIGLALLSSAQQARADNWLAKTNTFLYRNITRPTCAAFHRTECAVRPVCDQALVSAIQTVQNNRLQIDLWEWYPNPTFPIYFYGGVGFGYPQSIKTKK